MYLGHNGMGIGDGSLKSLRDVKYREEFLQSSVRPGLYVAASMSHTQWFVWVGGARELPL